MTFSHTRGLVHLNLTEHRGPQPAVWRLRHWVLSGEGHIYLYCALCSPQDPGAFQREEPQNSELERVNGYKETIFVKKQGSWTQGLTEIVTAGRGPVEGREVPAEHCQSLLTAGEESWLSLGCGPRQGEHAPLMVTHPKSLWKCYFLFDFFFFFFFFFLKGV